MADREVRYVIRAINATRAGVNAAIRGLGAVARAGVRAGRRVMRAFANVGSFIFRQFRRAALGAAALGTVAVKMFAAHEEALNKFSVVFGKSAGDMEAAVRRLSKETGKSRTELLELAAKSGDIIKAMGYTEEETAALSKRLLKLAIDTASFKDALVPDVIDAFTAAFVKQRERLQSLGIVITDVDVAQQHYGNTTAKSTAKMTQQQIVTATMALLFKRLADGENDAAETAGQLTNAFRNFLGALRDTSIEVGGQIAKGLKLADMFVKLRKKVLEAATTIAESQIVEKWASRARIAIGEVIELFERISMGGETGAEALREIKSKFQTIFDIAAQRAGEILEKWGPRIGKAIREGFLSFDIRGAVKDAVTFQGVTQSEKDALTRKTVFGQNLAKQMPAMETLIEDTQHLAVKDYGITAARAAQSAIDARRAERVAAQRRREESQHVTVDNAKDMKDTLQ